MLKMVIAKPLYRPLKLEILYYLSIRIKLSSNEKQYYLNLKKGYEGEREFASWLKDLSDNYIILYDILIEHNNSLFQIDALVLTPTIVYLFEIKNYEGDFYIESDIWYTSTGNEIKNPILQLRRCESALRSFLQSCGYTLPINSHVVFTNSEFALFQAPRNQPIILPAQRNRFIKDLNMNAPHSKNYTLAKQFMSAHLQQSPYNLAPKFDYNSLKKGIICATCGAFLSPTKNVQFVCEHCGHKEKIDTSILRSIREFEILFPNKKITTNIIYNWCKIIYSKKTIRRILSKNYMIVGHGKAAHYVPK